MNNKASVREMITSKQFIIVFIMALCSITTGYYLVDCYKTYGQENGINDDFYFAKIGSIAAICNTIRFTWSTALDYFSYKMIYGSLVFI